VDKVLTDTNTNIEYPDMDTDTGVGLYMMVATCSFYDNLLQVQETYI
jgi:hypothetical protein